MRSSEQCELDENVNDGKIEIVYRIKENPALVREAARMGKDRAAQKDVNNLIEQLSLRNDNPGIGNRRVKGLKNVSERIELFNLNIFRKANLKDFKNNKWFH